jgi:demethylmenaquinone methyltransferase/2-methoxy-6-polyprenyl-1,4-benzoquinol methylase
MDNQAVAAISIYHAIFRAAAEPDDASAGEALAEIVRKCSPQIGPPRLHPRNPPALQHVGKAADGRLDFGKLRHGAAIWRRAFNAARGTSPMPDQVNFGDELVSPEEKTRRVGEVFSSVARHYDIMNDLMSGGMHRLWKDRFVNRVKPRPGEDILDMAGGTGDVAFRMARRGAHVTVADINADMLEVGKQRAEARGLTGLSWKVENAEALSFNASTFGAYTIVFGIRNVTDIPAALREAHRVLKRGGRFYCMEFSSTDWPGFGKLYETWADTMIPRIGKLVADDEESYRYLVESIRRFPKPQAFKKMVADAGFVRAGAEPMLGGLVTIHSGWKI